MAKSTPGLKKALKAIGALQGQMQGEANADYLVSLSAAGAGAANLKRQTRALTRELVLGQQQNIRALEKLAARSDRSTERVESKLAGTVNRYGSALGPNIERQFAPAGAVAAAGEMNVGAALKGGQRMGKVAQVVSGMAAAGAKAQEAAATYALNQALMARNMVDSSTIAQLTGQMYQTALQYNLEWQMAKKQQKMAEKAAGGTGAEATVQRLMDEGSSIAAGAADVIRAARDANDGTLPEDFSVTVAVEAWAMKNGYDPAGPEAAVFAATLRNMTANHMNAAPAFTSALSTLYSGEKGWEKWGPPLLQGAAYSTLAEETRRRFLAWLEEQNNADAEDQLGGTNIYSNPPDFTGKPLYGGASSSATSLYGQPLG